MFLTGEELAPLRATNQGVGVKYGSGPVEPLPICFAHKHVYASMTAANPHMNVL
jgi:hypothetical protein